MGRTITRPTDGAPYDNGVYQADSREMPAARFTAEDLPAYCCRMGDMGRTQRCHRTAMVNNLVTDLDLINRERTRQPRMRNDWRARNLAGWIAFAERRMAYYLATWELPACTGAEADRFAKPVRDQELALPACTC